MDYFIRFPKKIIKKFDKLDPTSLKVLISIYDSVIYTNDQFTPLVLNVSKLAKKSHVSRNTVYKSLLVLENLYIIRNDNGVIYFDTGQKYSVKKLNTNCSKIEQYSVKKLNTNCSKIKHSTPLKLSAKQVKREPVDLKNIYKEQTDKEWELLFENIFIKRLWNLHTEKEVISLVEKYGKNKDLDYQKQLEKNKEIARWARRLADISPDDDLSEDNASLRIYVSNCLIDAMIGGINVNGRFVMIMKKLLHDGERIKYPRLEEIKKAEDLERLLNVEFEHRKKETNEMIKRSEEKTKAVDNSVAENDRLYEENKDKFPELAKQAEEHAFNLLKNFPGVGKDIEHVRKLDRAKQAMFDRVSKAKFSDLLKKSKKNNFCPKTT